jgi:branched-chain amino acid transport system permease protein
MHNRPEGLLGHRKETASSVDLARPGTDRSAEKPTAADGGEKQ